MRPLWSPWRKYLLILEGFFRFSVLHGSENKKTYVTGGKTKVPVYVTRVINIDNSEVAILDSDLVVSETKKLSSTEENIISLLANHLQKLRLAFELATPAGSAFKPNQAFLQLTHETGVEHIFRVGSSDKTFELTLLVGSSLGRH